MSHSLKSLSGAKKSDCLRLFGKKTISPPYFSPSIAPLSPFSFPHLVNHKETVASSNSFCQNFTFLSFSSVFFFENFIKGKKGKNWKKKVWKKKKKKWPFFLKIFSTFIPCRLEIGDFIEQKRILSWPYLHSWGFAESEDLKTITILF